MTDHFYAAFEEKYRGSRELIKSRLQVYLPFIRPLLNFYPNGKSVDLGCGRGEWLEILEAEGLDPVGVDINDAMLQACRDLNLNVKNVDALDYLSSLQAESIVVVSGFHIAEHLPFEVLKQLVEQAKRVLVPGGLLILETPNPENITVATNSFYLDPTHKRPLPSELMCFLSEYYGFARHKVLRLQEDPDLHSQDCLNLTQVLSGVSPDYSVVSQQQASMEILDTLNAPFDFEYGISLKNVVKNFDNAIDLRFEDVNIKVQLQQALDLVQNAQSQAQQLVHLLERAQIGEQQAKSQLHQAEACTEQHLSQLRAIYRSRSWRITSPLRWLIHQFRLLQTLGLKGRIKDFVKKAMRKILFFIDRRPKLRYFLVRVTYHLGIANHMKSITQSLYSQKNYHFLKSDADLENLSPRALEIYEGLNEAIIKKRETGK